MESVGLSRIIAEESTKLEIEARKLEYQSSRKPRDESQTTKTHSETQAATRERGPDIKTSKDRVEFEDGLRSELATLSPLLKGYTTVRDLRERHPNFELWKLLSNQEQQELLTEPFKPRAYARTLTARQFAVTKWAIEKDRPKLKRHKA